ncbi:MAG TPA: DUF805 domain-containing protein [Caulobacteraceae bacterium]|jgi:uncharacterized membrane protein YhaH (DUF805 family)|nr:DUF805 domain-containing protein [Caulobacteraceae bacterium]
MNFSSAVESGFRRYVDFNGRSSRAEFWYWILFYYAMWFGVLIVLQIGAAIAGRSAGYRTFEGLIYLLFWAGFALPTLTNIVRRLHDTNRSGWWYFIAFTIVGLIPLIIWLCARGTIGENQYGADPLSGDQTTTKTDEAWVS